MTPGFYQSTALSNEQYHSGPGVSVSGLKLLDRSPAHYRAGFRSESRSMFIGTALHAAVLEPDVFEAEYIVAEGFETRRDKGFKKWSGEQTKHVIMPGEMQDVIGMRAAIQANSDLVSLLTGAAFELSCYAEDPVTGELCRIRMDLFSRIGWIVDLKTCTDARPQAVSKRIGDLGYHIQGAFYTDVPKWLTGHPPRGFILAFVESAPPYSVALYQIDDQDIERGRNEYRRLLNRYHQCRVRDEWPHYGTGIQTVGLTNWKRNEIDFSEVEE